MIYKDGIKYTGFFKHGLKHGKGLLYGLELTTSKMASNSKAKNTDLERKYSAMEIRTTVHSSWASGRAKGRSCGSQAQPKQASGWTT